MPFPPSDGAIIYAVTHKEKIFLVRALERDPHWPPNATPMWKMPGESIYPGEALGRAFKRGLKEETGLDVPLPKHTHDLLSIRSRKYTLTELDRRLVEKTRRHLRYFYRLELRYRTKLMSLGGKVLAPKGGERLETKVFDIAELDTIPDFLPYQRPLLPLLVQAGDAQAA